MAQFLLKIIHYSENLTSLSGYQMLDGILEFVVGWIGRILGYIFIEIVFDIVCYSIGYIIIKGITFGRYPKYSKKKMASSKRSLNRTFFISITGVLAFAAAAFIYMYLRN